MLLHEILLHDSDEYDTATILLARALNYVIENIRVDGSRIVFMCAGKPDLVIEDTQRSCCEHRYMTCDENLDDFRGAVLLGAMLKGVDGVHDSMGDHDVQFLEVFTSGGMFTIASHNEHTGYYGGFTLEAKEKR